MDIGQNNGGHQKVAQSPQFAARVAAAFTGKDTRTIVHSIKYKFPDMRTGDLSMNLMLIKNGDLATENILKQVEALNVG